MRLSDLGEFGLIEKIKSIIGSPGDSVIKGIGDDCAVVEKSGGNAMLLTTDVLVEGVHFTKGFINPENLGRKALAINISDIAAMGGTPRYALLSLAAPESTETGYIGELISGIDSMANEFSVSVLGGDTSLSPDGLIVNIFIIGEALKDNVLYRYGAKPGQVIFVTGEVGSSAAGLDILKRGLKKEKYGSLIDAHISPYPHVKEGNIISSSGLVTSLIDISDGVISDLRHICEESRVGAIIERNKLPISDICRQYCSEYGLSAEEFALYGGEDYVFMGTVPEHSYYKLRDLLNSEGCPLLPIGRTKAEPGIRLQNQNGGITEIEINGYDHFRNRRG